MPLYTYKCIWCNYERQFLLPSDQVQVERFCEACKLPLHRVLKGSSSQVKEVVDNGIMARRVELTKP